MKLSAAWVIGVFCILALGLGENVQAQDLPSAFLEKADVPALDAATNDACNRRIVILGEVGTHGDGHAIAFKAALVHRLVAQCGFKAVLWESSFYEFDHLDRLIAMGTPISRDQVSAAIGGIWNKDAALQPLIDDLTYRANRREVMLGGLDSGWDQAGIPYTTDVLPKALAVRLSSAEATICANAFHQRLYYGYDPKDVAAHQQLMSCLEHIRTTIPNSNPRDLDVLDGLLRYISDDLQPMAVKHSGSEQARYLNLRLLLDRLPVDAKVVIWTATVHGRYTASEEDGSIVKHMGGYIHDAFGDQSLLIAMGAAGGRYANAIDPTAYPLLIAPDSLEARVLEGSHATTVYVPPARLKTFGVAPAGLFFHSPDTRNWSDTIDAAVIFREEYPVPHISAAIGLNAQKP